MLDGIREDAANRDGLWQAGPLHLGLILSLAGAKLLLHYFRDGLYFLDCARRCL